MLDFRYSCDSCERVVVFRVFVWLFERTKDHRFSSSFIFLGDVFPFLCVKFLLPPSVVLSCVEWHDWLNSLEPVLALRSKFLHIWHDDKLPGIFRSCFSSLAHDTCTHTRNNRSSSRQMSLMAHSLFINSISFGEILSHFNPFFVSPCGMKTVFQDGKESPLLSHTPPTFRCRLTTKLQLDDFEEWNYHEKTRCLID